MSSDNDRLLITHYFMACCLYIILLCLFNYLGLATDSRKPMQYSQIGKSIEITGSPVPITPRRLRAISCADLMKIKSKLDNIAIRYETLLCVDIKCDNVMTLPHGNV